MGPFLLYRIPHAVKRVRAAPIAAALVLIACGTLFGENPLDWLNRVRRAAGVPGVQADALLSLTAEDYARRLASRGMLSHKGDDGSSALDRYRALGGTEVRVGEILGAGPAAGLVQEAWMASAEHRQVALAPEWTHAGWGSAAAGTSVVVVMLFTRKLVVGLELQSGTAVFSARGRFLPVYAAAPVLINGLDEVAPSAWEPASRSFVFEVPRSSLEGYLRLGFRTADGSFTLTNAFSPVGGPGR